MNKEGMETLDKWAEKQGLTLEELEQKLFIVYQEVCESYDVDVLDITEVK